MADGGPFDEWHTWPAATSARSCNGAVCVMPDWKIPPGSYSLAEGLSLDFGVASFDTGRLRVIDGVGKKTHLQHIQIEAMNEDQ